MYVIIHHQEEIAYIPRCKNHRLHFIVCLCIMTQINYLLKYFFPKWFKSFKKINGFDNGM